MRMTLAAVLLALTSTITLGGTLVELRVADHAGVPRRSEPITSGIPFPRGLVKDAADLRLVDEGGKVVPAAFTAINRWPQDGSVRVALLDTQLDVPARGTRLLKVLTDGRAAEPPARIRVEKDDSTITVITGPLKFTVRRKGFRLFEGAWLDESGDGRFDEGHRVLAPSREGLAMTVAGLRYTSARDLGSTVAVEEQNPMRVTLVARGKLTAEGGRTGYDYIVRIHAYAGSSRLKVVPTVIKKYGDPRDLKHFISDLALDLQLAGKGPFDYALGGEDEPATGTLQPKESAWVLVENSDRWVFGGAAKGSGRCKSTKPLTLGWADLAGPQGGVALGIYRFWQNFPKAIEVRGDGTIDVGLYPRRLGKDLQFFTGMARTHEILFLFHSPRSRRVEDVQAVFVGFQRPLFATAPPEWYCRSGVFGSIAPVGAKLVDGATEAFERFDRRIAGYFRRLMTVHQDRWRKRGITMDAYGWLAYGDTLHWVWHHPKTEGTPWDIAWDSNYYDLPHLACLYFARTGRREFFDFFVDHTWHLMDIDVVHWHPKFPLGGASRRCPATNHVGFDPPEHTYPIINVDFSHHKSESLFERYWLLGDRWSEEVAMELLGRAFRSNNADYGGTRKPGHQIITLVEGYWHTGQRKYLQRARKVIDDGIRRQERFDGGFNRRPNFTDGILLEAFAKYYQATGEEDVLRSIQRACDWLMKSGRRWSNCTFAFTLLWKKTGREEYLREALRCLEASKPHHLSKDMGHMYRNAPNATGLLVAKTTGGRV